MKVSLNTVKLYTDVDLSVDELVTKINQQLGGVEGVEDLGERYKGAVIVRVVECSKHPDADRLHVTKVDDGGAIEDVERDENGLVQVVCGAPNVRSDMYAVWLPPKSTVPASYADSELFVLDARKLRGVMSYGMLASPQELALGDKHEGILEIDPDEQLPGNRLISPGVSFAQTYGLDDTTIDIENKMFTHRPDCFGQLGIAREIAGISHKPFLSPDWYTDAPQFTPGSGLPLTVSNQADKKVPRFMAVAIRGVSVRPSPVWLQAELVRLGSKPINNIVDVTNYLMLLTGQPLHAYDYDKLAGATLGVRAAKADESVTLLNGKTYKLSEDDIVIVDGDGPVGLGGVMGGGESEVSDDTKNIVLECATFDMYAIRKTSMRHGLFTDAVTRFNKGQSPLQNDRILALAILSVADVAGGEVASQVSDEITDMQDQRAVTISVKDINSKLGLSLSYEEIETLLTNVEFIVNGSETLEVTPPFWRTDITIAEDVVEEVGRLYGFDALPKELPRRTIKPAPVSLQRHVKQQVREVLSRIGAHEVLTYSFVHSQVLQKAQQDESRAYRLSNALSPELQYYRHSVLPSLLDKVHGNIKAGHDEFTLFEIGKGHDKQLPLNEEGLPTELEMIDLVYSSKTPLQGAAYYRIKWSVEQLVADLNLTPIVFRPLDASPDDMILAPFDPDRSARVETTSGISLGVVGELKKSVLKKFKLPAYTAAASLSTGSLLEAVEAATPSYRKLSRYPSVIQDISLKVAETVNYGVLEALAYQAMESVWSERTGVFSIEPLSIYRPDGSASKTITLRLNVSSYERTLTDKDVEQLLEQIAAAASNQLGAERI